MRVSETPGIFQPVTNHAVKANVRHPDQRIRREDPAPGQYTHNQKQQRQQIAVCDVIGSGANARTGEVSQQRKIGHKKEHRKKHPRSAAVPIEEDSRRQYGKPLKAKPRPNRTGSSIHAIETMRITKVAGSLCPSRGHNTQPQSSACLRSPVLRAQAKISPSDQPAFWRSPSPPLQDFPPPGPPPAECA